MTAVSFQNSIVEKLIRVGSRIDVDPTDVLFFRAETNYTTVYLNSGDFFVVSTTLKIIQDRFIKQGFFRSHRSFLINLNYVRSLNEGKSIVTMSNNTNLQISRRKKEGLITALSVKN